MAKLLIIGLVNGEPSPFDGQWLVEYDPSRPGIDPEGKPLIAHVLTTPDPQQAREFPTIRDAEECWKQIFGTRKDGRPNRPLTAFIVKIQESDVVLRRPDSEPQRGVIGFVAEFFYA